MQKYKPRSSSEPKGKKSRIRALRKGPQDLRKTHTHKKYQEKEENGLPRSAGRATQMRIHIRLASVRSLGTHRTEITDWTLDDGTDLVMAREVG